MVATDSADASLIGATILERGGNAFEAAIATSLALNVSRPESTGLGGGGFLIAYVAAEKRFVALDFRETAPKLGVPRLLAAAAQRAADTASGYSPSIYGGLAVATPGLAAGLAEIHRRWCKLPFASIVGPVVGLTTRGFLIDEHFLQCAKKMDEEYQRWPQIELGFARTREKLVRQHRALQAGARLRRPDQAELLKMLARDGPQAVYRGPIADAILAAVAEGGGVLSQEDLRDYRVIERQPLRFRYRERYEIITMPLPSCGGVILAQALHSLEPVDLKAAFLRSPPDATHEILEALKHGFANRSYWMGDPARMNVSPDWLLGLSYALADPAGAPESYGTRQPPEGAGVGPAPGGRDAWPGPPTHEAGKAPAPPAPDDRGTSHFCIIDRDGNIVSMTETINGPFGSLVMTEPYGILLNNQMDDFTIGGPNLFGLTQSEANRPVPGMRPLSSMTPTIVLKDGKPILVLGASGGPRIVSSVLNVLLNVIEFDMPLPDAVETTRAHHQWSPDLVFFDKPPLAELAAGLESHGQKLSSERRSAAVQAVQILDDGTLVGVSDPRKGGKPRAVEERH